MSSIPATTDVPAVESRWWSLVAVALLGQLLVAALAVLMFYAALASLGVVPSVPLDLAAVSRLAVPGFLLAGVATAAGIVGLRLDAPRIVRADVGWEPSGTRYAVGSIAAAVVVPPLVPVVAGYYLYRRHRAVGRP